MKSLDTKELIESAELFCKQESGKYRSELFGVTDGKAVGTFLGISDKTRDDDEKREVNTFGTYIGRGKKEPYADWVKDYVDKMSQKK